MLLEAGEYRGTSLLPSRTAGKNPATGLSGYVAVTSGVFGKGLKFKKRIYYIYKHSTA